MPALIATLAQIGALILKELLAIIKEPSSRVILFAPALMQALLFGYGATYDLNHAPYAVLDQSRSAASTELLARLDGAGVFARGHADLVRPDREPDRRRQGADGDQHSCRLPGQAGGRAARAAASHPGRPQFLDRRRRRRLPGVHRGRLQRAAWRPGPVAVERRAWYNPSLESRWTLMPGLIAALSMLQTLLLAALSVARASEQGTFDQLLVTPLRPMQILVGKALPAILVGLIQSTIIFLIIRFWFQIPMNGSVWLLYFGLLSFNIAVVGVGLSISALSNSMQQAMLYTFLVIMPLMLLSGLLTPVRNMPEALQLATYVNPLRFGMNIVRGVYLEGAGWREIGVDFIPLLLLAAVTLPLAAWLFRNRMS